MGNECIIGGEVANAIDVNNKALHLVLHPIMMLIMILMKRNKKLLIIQRTSPLLSP